MKKRGSTVETVLGTMLNFLNLKRVNTRGIRGANKHVMMSAIAYNLKKLMKFSRKTVITQYQTITQLVANQFSFLLGYVKSHYLSFNLC
ncbi:MAG: hypothetical protein EAY81_02035 [Bacteroidetes bacterium]|nr:MAG: hypothetical protein EAY81_02035 [Bacteroidota bacterium]